MNILTPYGYKDITELNIGDEVVAYDINTGDIIINYLEGKELWTINRYGIAYGDPTKIDFPSGSLVYNESGSLVTDCNGNQLFDEFGNELYHSYRNPKLDCDGNPVYDGISYSVEIAGPILKTAKQAFEEIHGEFTFYRINDRWNIYKDQSVWANMNVCHAKDLKVGDIIYDGDDNDIVITSITEVNEAEWWRLSISGDHSFITDNLTLHNASRYWVGGGSANTWVATANTNWGSASGGANNASVPTSADDVIFDGAAPNGNTTSTISATITILSLNITAGYTSTMTHNAVLTIAGNWTMNTGYTIAGTSGITISAASTITNNGKEWPNALTFSNANTKTLVGDLSVRGLYTSIGAPTTINTSSLTPNASLICYGGMFYQSAGGLSNAKIILVSGTWSGTIPGCSIDISGSITLGATAAAGASLGTTTLRWISGSVTTTGNTFTIAGASPGSTILDVEPITWNNISFAGGTTNLSSSLNVSGLTTIAGTTTLNTASVASPSASLICGGGITTTSTIAGNAKVVLAGGSWTGNSLFSGRLLQNNTDISGSIIINGNSVAYGGVAGNVLRWVSGSVTTAGSNFRLEGSCILDTDPIIWSTISCTASDSTLILSSSLIADVFVTNNNIVFTNSAANRAGFNFGTFTTGQTVTRTCTLQANTTYIIRNAFSLITQPISSNFTFTSNSGTDRAILILLPGASCNLNSSFTRIDASRGRPINTFNGTVTNCVNVNRFNDKATISGI